MREIVRNLCKQAARMSTSSSFWWWTHKWPKTWVRKRCWTDFPVSPITIINTELFSPGHSVRLISTVYQFTKNPKVDQHFSHYQSSPNIMTETLTISKKTTV